MRVSWIQLATYVGRLRIFHSLIVLVLIKISIYTAWWIDDAVMKTMVMVC